MQEGEGTRYASGSARELGHFGLDCAALTPLYSGAGNEPINQFIMAKQARSKGSKMMSGQTFGASSTKRTGGGMQTDRRKREEGRTATSAAA